MSAVPYVDDTRPAFPLGQPLDGLQRFSMTHEMAELYRWLIVNRPHHEEFTVNFRDVARLTGMQASKVHDRAMGLVEREWLEKTERGKYRFVQPIMRFREPRDA